MQRFYSTITELNFFTLSANSLLFNQPCPHCQCSDQWVSHGFSYDQSGQVRGKRLVCCARFGKHGCGRTIALYLASILPTRRYLTVVLFQFISSLIQGNTIEQAYFVAIGHKHHSDRQAYRWLSALNKRLGDYRTSMALPDTFDSDIHHRSNRLANLLTTLKHILHRWPDLSRYQIKFNQAFC